MRHTTIVHKGESVTFRLDPVLKAELMRLAEKDNKSLGELLRELARERVALEQHRRYEAEARRQSLAIAERADRPGTDEYVIMRELDADLANGDDD